MAKLSDTVLAQAQDMLIKAIKALEDGQVDVYDGYVAQAEKLNDQAEALIAEGK